MRITITITERNRMHIRFGLFVNGAHSGQICLRQEEWNAFMEILQPDTIYDNTEPKERRTTYDQINKEKK